MAYFLLIVLFIIIIVIITKIFSEKRTRAPNSLMNLWLKVMQVLFNIPFLKR